MSNWYVEKGKIVKSNFSDKYNNGKGEIVSAGRKGDVTTKFDIENKYHADYIAANKDSFFTVRGDCQMKSFKEGEPYNARILQEVMVIGDEEADDEVPF